MFNYWKNSCYLLFVDMLTIFLCRNSIHALVSLDVHHNHYIDMLNFIFTLFVHSWPIYASIYLQSSF